MRRLPIVSLGLLVGVLQGCANYLYQGEITAQDSSGQERRVVLYWPKTDPLLGDPKAGPAILLTQCGARITFVERPERIVFRGTPSQDRPSGQDVTISEGQICGRFVGEKRFVDIDGGTLSLIISCEPITSEFSLNRAYLRASPDPYQFQIKEDKSWSLFGKVPDAPKPPACSDTR